MRRSFVVVPLAAIVFASLGAQPASLVARGAGTALALASLVVLTGWSKQLNLHVAAIGLGWGAYAAVGLVALGVPVLVAIVLAPLAVAPAALIVGVIAVRFRGLELAIATLAAGLAFEQSIFRALGRTIASTGTGTPFESSLAPISRPGVFESDLAYALLSVAVAAVILFIVDQLKHGSAGRTLQVVADREIVAEARGVDVFAWRVGAFVASIALAAAGGALLAGQSGAVTPDAFGLTRSLQLLAIATVIGIDRLDRVFAGAALLLASQELAGISALSWLAGDRADLLFGIGLLVVLARRSRAQSSTTAAPTPSLVSERNELIPSDTKSDQLSPTRLRVEQVRVSFGTNEVLRGVSLKVAEGEIVGLVGANGAGKSTLFNAITGLVEPETGRIFVANQDVTDMPPHRRARVGLARTFQGVEVFGGLSVEEGLRATAGLHEGTHPRDPREALQEIGIAEVANAYPETLPFTTLRLVEIATALVSDPEVVLLDEPLAGTDRAEKQRVLAAITRLRAEGRAVLLVEHDRASIDAVADRVLELKDGQIFAATKAVHAEPVARKPKTTTSGVARKRRSRVAKSA